MKRLGFGLVLVVTFALSTAAAPMLGVDSVTYDFGSVPQGTIVAHTFILTNLGDATLAISATRASCGCTTTALSKSSLAPGESVSLDARVDTSEFGGAKIMKQIYIDSNDPATPSAVVYIEGDVTQLPPYDTTLGDVKYLFYLLIDVRSAKDYASGHLIGAMNIPSADLPLWIGILPKDVIVILYDNTGQDSATQARYLESVGFSQAKSLAGGLAGWSLVPSAASDDVGTLPQLAAPAPAALQSFEIANGDLRSIYLILVDLRTPEAYANRGGHFMGAVNIPSSELSGWSDKLPKDVTIVLYDQTGEESDRQAQALQAAGLAKVQSLAGGLDAWVRSYGITFLIAEPQ